MASNRAELLIARSFFVLGCVLFYVSLFLPAFHFFAEANIYNGTNGELAGYEAILWSPLLGWFSLMFIVQMGDLNFLRGAFGASFLIASGMAGSAPIFFLFPRSSMRLFQFIASYFAMASLLIPAIVRLFPFIGYYVWVTAFWAMAIGFIVHPKED